RAMNFTGFIFLNLGDFCTARLFFARAIEADKTNIQPYLNLAMGHAMCGHTDEAIIYMQKSYIYAPSDEKIVESGKSIDNILKQVLKSNSEESDSIKVPKATFKEKWMKHKHSQLVELLFEDEEPVSTHIYDGSRHGINFVFLPLTGHVKKSSNGRYGRARRIKDLEHIETTLIMSSMLIQDISEKEKGLDALRQIGFVSSDPTNQKHSEKR
ncbi:MAG: hypothetical protein Q8O89_07310, partial [Nanoarchaeota archaeon]|nr:hypothetical protein [Nanoarchaeota archaeon]